MKKGLRQPDLVVLHTPFSVRTLALMKKGLRRDVAHSRTRRQGSDSCPDEEGIKTRQSFHVNLSWLFGLLP